MGLLYREFVSERYDDQGRIVGYRLNIPERFNFAFDVVDRLAEEKPHKTAMVWCNDSGDERRFTFRDMKDGSDRAAAFFQRLGIRKGDKVMLILKRHYEFWHCILALHRIGAIAIPATDQLMTRDLVYRLNASGAKAVVCTAEGRVSEHVDEAARRCPSLRTKVMARGVKDGWVSYEEGVAAGNPGQGGFKRPAGDEMPRNSDTMLLYFSSGTTGMPKMVAHDFTYPLGHIPTAVYWQSVDPDGLHFTVSDTGWGKAVWGGLYGQWLSEAAVFVLDFDRFTADSLLKCFAKYGITSFCAPPTIYRFLIKEDLSKYDLSSLRHALTAGEALNPEVYQRFYDMTGLKLMEGFGQTETTLTVGTFKWMQPKPGSMGMPSPAYSVDIVDENGKSVPTGSIGEIAVRTDRGRPAGMFLEYYRDEEKTSEAWHDDIYRTGDMAWRDSDGYFWYVGRADDIIKSSGYRIGPFEVESVMMEHPAVLECAVTGVPDPERGEVVKATVVLAKGYEPSDTLKRDLQDYVKTHTAPYKYPRIVEFVDSLPKTISGKIRRTEIRQKDRLGQAARPLTTPVTVGGDR